MLRLFRSNLFYLRTGFGLFIFLFFIENTFAQQETSRDSLITHAEQLIRSTPNWSLRISDSLLKVKELSPIQQGILERIMGRAFYISGKYEEAGKHLGESVKILKRIPAKDQLGLSIIEQAKLFRKLKMYEQAITLYQQAYDIFSELSDKNNIATVLNEWGVVYEMEGDYQKAINHYNQSLEIKQQLNDSMGIAYSYSFLSYVYLLNKQFKPAEEYGIRSFNLFKRLKDPISIALQSSDFALVYETQGDYNTAIYYLEYSDSIAERMNYADLRSGNYERLAKIYAAMGNYNLAYSYRLKHGNIKDSIFTIASQRTIAELNTQYQVAEKDRDLLMQQNRINRQRFLLVLALLLLFIISGLVAYIFHHKKQKEKELKLEAIHQQEILKMEALNSIQQDRLRISRDLHDNIGAYLTYIKSTIDDLTDSASNKDDRVITLKELTAETISELRRTVWLINKPSVNVEEWIIRLKEHYKKIPQIKVSAIGKNSSLSLTALQATALYRIVQEAINNSLKYSGSSVIEINIEETKNYLIVSISDNGSGFEETKVTQGFGLNNMKQRAEEIGSTYVINSSPGNGTVISVHIPI